MSDRGRPRDEQDFADFLSEAVAVFDALDTPEGSGSDQKEGLPYLEPMPNHRGEGERGSLDYDKIGALLGKGEKERWVTVGDELRKAAGCGKTGIGMNGIDRKTGWLSGSSYVKFIFCYRWICEKCGSKGGRINKKRFSRIMGRLVGEIQEVTNVRPPGEQIRLGDGTLDMRQLVFTVPFELRKYFQTRKDISALNRIPERIAKKTFPGCPSIRYFHGFGDKEKSVYNPHVNIHVFETSKKKLKLEEDRLQDIKDRYALGLKGYIYEAYGVKVPDEVLRKENGHYHIDVHYEFVEGDKEYERKRYDKEQQRYVTTKIEGYKLMIHRIMYMSRPCPGYAHLDAIKGNEDLLRLFVVEMKGFHYITNCGTWKVKDGDRAEEIREMQGLAGEPLKVARDRDGHIVYVSRGEFNLLYRRGDYEELTEGFFRVNTPGQNRKDRRLIYEEKKKGEDQRKEGSKEGSKEESQNGAAPRLRGLWALP